MVRIPSTSASGRLLYTSITTSESITASIYNSINSPPLLLYTNCDSDEILYGAAPEVTKSTFQNKIATAEEDTTNTLTSSNPLPQSTNRSSGSSSGFSSVVTTALIIYRSCNFWEQVVACLERCQEVYIDKMHLQ